MDVAGGAGFYPRRSGSSGSFATCRRARYHPLQEKPQTVFTGTLRPRSRRERLIPTGPQKGERNAQPPTVHGSVVLTAVLLAAAPPAHADVVTDANAKAAEVASRHPATPIAVRMMAIVQVSVFEAVNAITARYPAFRVKIAAAPGASVDAAVAAATRTALLKLMPPQQSAIEADYQAALKSVPDGPAKSDGIAVGEQAATAVLASCAEDGAMAPNTYRPHTTPGVYVPTVFPAVPHWGKRKPWVMTSGDQFRPGPPPSLTQ